MRKSVFRKYFSITAGLVIVSFIIFGVVLMIFTRTEWTKEKYTLLQKNVEIVSQISSDVLNNELDYNAQVKPMVGAISQIIDSEIFIVNTQGKLVLASSQERQENAATFQLKQKILEKTLAKNYNETGTLGGIFQNQCFVVSTPIIYQGNSIGAVFAAVPMADSFASSLQMLKVLVICAFAVLILVFIAVYFASAQMTRPLRQMAYVARLMEKGEFYETVKVTTKDEVGMLAEAFNKMAKALGALENMRRSFISSVSHELKTPMTTIAGFVDGILDGTIEPKDQEKYLKVVSDETKRLARLVNSMLQLSRLESEQVTISPVKFNFSDLVIQVLLSFERNIEQKNLEIRGLEDLSVIYLDADYDLIYQVVYNLVENAIKFTPENGYIEVGILSRHKKINLHIKNSGAGLAQEEMSRIFERFYKTDRSRSSDKTGVGFGLYIVKTIVDLHNGKITVSSVADEFTAFDVTLPETQIIAQVAHATERS